MLKKALSLALVCALALWSVPAFAVEPASEITNEKLESNVPQDRIDEDESLVDVVENQNHEESGNEEDHPRDGIEGTSFDDSEEYGMMEVSDGEDLAVLSVLSGSYIYRVDLEQVDSSTKVKVSFPNLDALLSTQRADMVTVEAVMNYRGTITRSVTMEKKLADLSGESGLFEMDFATYGKFSVVAKFYKNGELVQTGDVQTMGIVADEYNIAPVSATLPVTFFSMALWGQNSIRYDTNGNIVPTIMLMERPASWNWDSLPEGVYPLPYLSKEEVAYQPSDFTAASDLFREHTQAMADYVGDLYEMNPNAKYNLYCVDFYIGLIQSVLYANGIPEDHYSITVMSDGSFSGQRFSEVYNDAYPSAKHDGLKAAWEKAKQEAYATGKVSVGYNLWEPNGSLYAAVDSESNAQWWLARTDLLVSKGDGNAFGANIAQKDSQVVQVSIKDNLEALQAQGDTATQEFKALYNFSDAYFADAEAAGKDVMLFLGTRVTNEVGFSDYARFTMAYYGDQYKYYYKGHPGTPTDFYPEKIAELEALGIQDVDSSVAAELILFFYPDIFLSGYTSTTYQSVSPDMAKGLFRITKATAMGNPAYAVMDWWISPVVDSTDKAIKELCTVGDSNYLVEFSDEQLEVLDYAIAIWNSTTSTISYYRLEDGKYTPVGSTQGGGSLVDGGVYTLGSKLAPNQTLDVASASDVNGANVQIYNANESFAQRFRLAHVGGGYYTIQNAKSGKMLDVESAGQESGTNVHQWESNNTDAQKWKIVDTGDGDGSCYLISKCNGLYLDHQWGQAQSGANIWVYTGNESDAQKFYLNKVNPVVEDGSYNVVSSLNGKMVLDVAMGSKDNGANVQIYESNQTAAQVFELKFDPSTGYYVIANKGSGKFLDTMYGGDYAGANVWQYEGNGTLAQNWSIKQMDDGSFTLYAATGAGCCLDVASAATQNGTNVQIWDPNGSAAQKWKFNKVA